MMGKTATHLRETAPAGALALALALASGCSERSRTPPSSRGPARSESQPEQTEDWVEFHLALPHWTTTSGTWHPPEDVRLRPGLPPRPFRAPRGTTNVARGKPVTRLTVQAWRAVVGELGGKVVVVGGRRLGPDFLRALRLRGGTAVRLLGATGRHLAGPADWSRF